MQTKTLNLAAIYIDRHLGNGCFFEDRTMVMGL